MIKYCSMLETKFGMVSIIADEEGILCISGNNQFDQNQSMKENQWTKEAKKQMREYFEGTRREFHLPLIMKGTSFQNSVWSVLQSIPYGTTISYKEVCKRIQNEKACQAVGTAVGKNPFYIVVPCHRVISSDGTIGGYALGTDLKRKLLLLEGINI